MVRTYTTVRPLYRLQLMKIITIVVSDCLQWALVSIVSFVMLEDRQMAEQTIGDWYSRQCKYFKNLAGEVTKTDKSSDNVVCPLCGVDLTALIDAMDDNLANWFTPTSPSKGIQECYACGHYFERSELFNV